MTKRSPKTTDRIRAHLGSLPADALVDLLIEQASRDDDLRDRLLVDAVKRGATDVDLKSFQRSITASVLGANDDRDGYGYTSSGYASDVHRTISRLDDMLDAGHAAAVIELAEYALDTVSEAMGTIDDSDGYYSEIVENLEDLHLRACVAGRPDPVGLARRLFRYEVDGEWDMFTDAVATYADVLGDAGITEFRRLAEQRWAKIPSVGPGDDDRDRYGTRAGIARVMEALAELSGDLDARIAVRSRDLSMPHDWLKIAELCRDAGRHDEALSWAERGVAAFPDRHDPRLDEFLCDEYHRRGRGDDAVGLVWGRFASNPVLTTYQGLVEQATQTGVWPVQRSHAQALLRKVATERNPTASTAGRWVVRGGPSPYETLIEVLLWEGNGDEAWALAVEHECSHRLWLRLAAFREVDHPDDAIPVYQREAAQLIDRKNNSAYAEAVKTMARLETLFGRAGRGHDFIRYVAEVRAGHKPKRNLMKLLDGKGW